MEATYDTFINPVLAAPRFRNRIFIIALLRSIFACLFIQLADRLINFGTSPILLSAGVITGIFAGTVLSFSKLSTRGFISIGVLSYLAYYIVEWLSAYAPIQNPARIFLPFVIGQHLSLTLGFLYIGALTSWYFWRAASSLTVETLFLAGAAIYALSGHRNYHFDSPRILDSFAWQMGVDQLTILVIVGASLLVLLLAYVYFASLPGIPRAGADGSYELLDSGKVRFSRYALLFSILSIAVFLICREVYRHYNQSALSRTANGVGEEKQEGISPLSFHSALGSTNQPAAMVRLEGDYADNPFTPMMYLRESALSQFSGQELVNADPKYDRDLNNTEPDQSFKTEEDTTLEGRTPLAQSIFLLAEHKTAFAVDYPLSIVRLKNPNEKRFKAAYRAYSIAPAYKFDDLARDDVAIGDPRWDEETRKHYLETHPDPRYRELAEKIADGVTSDMGKVFAVTNYLSKTAIYTLSPNHDVAPGEDPTAPFLFGDHRGYCVHFAHATVFLLRSLGIPSRIGTGYLTDLSQAKDGHILLRMSDRHAWAEVYVVGRGWVPFDTKPEQVESHADTQIDMKMLEELMAMLGPGEEILPDEVLKDEKNVYPTPTNFIPDTAILGNVLLTLLAAFILLKAYIRYSWLLPAAPRTRLYRSYRGLAAALCDLGYRRALGETREEFRSRMTAELQGEQLGITRMLNAEKYGRATQSFDDKALRVQAGADRRSLRSVRLYRRLAALLNPASVLSFLMGGRW